MPGSLLSAAGLAAGTCAISTEMNWRILPVQILVVEDSPVYRQLLTSYLQEWGFPFKITKDGSEAWTLLQRPDCPKLVLLDWVLPDIDGVELCRRIRLAGSGNSYSYIILLTGKDGKKDMLEAMQAGADDYLAKPFDQLELKARLLVGMRIFGLKEEIVSAREAMRYATEKQLHLRSAALEAAANGIMITDRHGTIVWVNHAFTRITGYSKEEALGKNSRVLKSGEQPESYYAELWSTISSGKVWQGEIVNRRKDGTTYTEEMTITPVSRDVGNPADRYFIAIKQDITKRKRAEERVQYLAYYDALTGLPNRTLLQDRLAKALAGARRRKDKVAILFLDLDRFKDINDSLGHSLGDLFLQEVAERLKTWGREQDTVARLSGDEFLIVLTRIKDVPDAAIAAERFMDAMTAEFVVQGHSLSIGCSVGISIYPEHGVDGETLIKNADAAMYSAKQSGRNNFRFFTDDMNAQVVERLTLESGLRLALDKK